MNYTKEQIVHAVRARLNTASPTIMVVGDVMLDVFVYGRVKRINPEDPGAPLLDIEPKNSWRYFLGGAGNVAANIVSLQGNVILYGLLGEDSYGQLFRSCAAAYQPQLTFKGLTDGHTIAKTRYVEKLRNRQIARIDSEEARPLSEHHQQVLLSQIKQDLPRVDAIILSDYCKGMLTGTFPQEIIALAHNHQKYVLSDFKPKNNHLFRTSSLICPNLQEAESITGMEVRKNADLKDVVEKLENILQTPYTIVTCGSDGIISKERNKEMKHITSYAREVADVTGAGDTVVAAMALCIAKNYAHHGDCFDVHDAAEIANYAAGNVVAKAGTATTTIEEIVEAILR